MNQKKLLTPEEGAVFWGKIEDLGGGDFRASCGARLDQGSHIDEEVPAIQMFNSARRAQRWIEEQAARRGFESYRLE
jgi:hypothetical protein